MSRKEKILEAATELFARKGFNGTASSEIAQSAGVAQGTVFHHFGSKENLLVSICDELVLSYVKGIEAAADGPGTGWECLERVLNFSLSFLGERSDSIAVAFRETRVLDTDSNDLHVYFSSLMQKIINAKRECIRKGVNDGSIRAVTPENTALLLHFLIIGMHHTQVHGLLKIPDISGEIVEFCRRSLAVQNQAKEVECAGEGVGNDNI